MEKFTPLAKILHCRRQRRHVQIPPLNLAKANHKLHDGKTHLTPITAKGLEKGLPIRGKVE